MSTATSSLGKRSRRILSISNKRVELENTGKEESDRQVPSDVHSRRSQSAESMSFASTLAFTKPEYKEGETVHSFIELAKKTFYAERDPKQAECSSKYMQQLFPFVGLMTARRRTLQKEMFTQLPQPLDHQTLQDIVFALWYLPEREFQHLGCDIMKEKGEAAGWYSSTEQAGEQALHTIELLIRSKSWWDTIDLMASQMLSQLLSSHRHLIVRMDQWITDDCLWIRRAALVFQLPYYQLPAMADFPRLCRYIKLVGHQKEFFIQKAIGWSLRQFSKSPQLVDEVRAFVAANRCELTPLAVREASKYL